MTCLWVAVALTTSMCATKSPIPNAAMSAPPGPLSQAFTAAHGTAGELIECDNYDRASEVTEISLERTPCFGYCSTYTLTVRADGTVEYRGAANVQRAGLHHGRLPAEHFNYLAALADEIDYFALQPSYYCAVTDSPTVFTRVTRGSETKIVRHYAAERTGPARLRAFEEAIDAVYESIEWDK
jgi:Domain of unknown function (DUF6438)